MANTAIEYGWAYPAAGVAPGGSQGLQRSYPSWFNDYGYNASLADNADPAKAAPGVDPYSLLPSHAIAAAPDVAPQTAGSGGIGGANGSGTNGAAGSESGMNGNLTGNNAGFGAALGQFSGLGRSLYDSATGGSGYGDVNSMSGGLGGQGSSGIGSGGPAGMGAGALAGVDPGALNGIGDITAGMYRGGVVTPNRLQGRNPPGPDDGLVPMKLGEGVLTDKAMKHYGAGIVARLNKLQVPKEAFKR